MLNLKISYKTLNLKISYGHPENNSLAFVGPKNIFVCTISVSCEPKCNSFNPFCTVNRINSSKKEF